MTSAPKSSFVYVTYIRATPERVWEALTTPEFIAKFWFSMPQQSAFTVGAPWQITFEDGRVADSGEIVEADPPRRLAIKWRNEFRPELKAEGYGLCVYDIEPVDKQDGTVKLTVTHSIDVEASQLIAAVSGGWPQILANLKSLLETGDVVLRG